MEAVRTVDIPRASAAWKLIMQSGVGLAVTVGVPLSEFFTAELGLTAQAQQLIEALVLDGMPVDDPATAIIEDQARLAFAAGLPGIAGLSMKKNSAVRALRGGITYRSHEAAHPHSGRITLALYSLVLPALGGHFLRRGIWVTPEQFIRYARFAPDDLCLADGRRLPAADLARELAAAADELLFTAVIADGPHA
ncbi:MAG: hypothetical protein LBV79_02340 [Candidatus Adiutrix sp.]|jgi:hypothetical protein|nr:hypothetical protein [Candidatus Adiutrix sp.]